MPNNQQPETPVYLFTGFLESGKTKLIQETLEDKEFQPDGKILIICCEEGIEEYDPSSFASQDVAVEMIENPEDLTPELFPSLEKKHRPALVMVEYNGMWPLDDFYQVLPENWFVYQEILSIDATTVRVYNQNMRQQMFDKLQSCELVMFNRVKPDEDVTEYHKLVRTVSRRSRIMYEYTDGTMDADTIQDPLPFDIDAEIIEIADNVYAEFYRDMSEDLKKYDGKKVRFKGLVARGPNPLESAFAVGRHIMTCCAADTTYCGMVCPGTSKWKVRNRDWIWITAKITIGYHKLYGSDGPLLEALDIQPAEPPEQPVATFFA